MWTRKETQYLKRYYGQKSDSEIARKLGTKTGEAVKKYRQGLGLYKKQRKPPTDQNEV